MREPSKNSVVLAVIMNAVIPGAGYMYMGRVGLSFLVLISVPFLIFAIGAIAWLPWMLIMCIDMCLLHSKQRKDYEATLKRCPACAEVVQREARLCKHCGQRFDVFPAITEQ